MTNAQFDALVALMRIIALGGRYRDADLAIEAARSILVTEQPELDADDYQAIYGWGGQG